MMNFNFKTIQLIKNEEKASRHINILSHYNDNTLQDKSGKLIRIFKLSGLDFVTKDEQTLKAYKIRRNHLFKSFSSHFACYFWQVRQKIKHYPAGDFSPGFASIVNERYKQQIKNDEMFHTELYLALMTKQPEGFINKGFSFFQYLSHRFNKKARQDYLSLQHKELNDATYQVMSAFSDYDCQLLSVYEKKGVRFSEPLTFLSHIINFDIFPFPLAIADAATLLPRKRLFFNGRSGTIEMSAANGDKKFAAILSIKGYSPFTDHDLLNELTSLRCEYVITQSFRFYDKQVAKLRLLNQQKEMLQSNEESVSQTEQIDEVFDDTASGEVGYGKHHLTLVCYADTQDKLNKQIGVIASRFADVDIAMVREDIACEAGFWAQLPGNFSYICRPADISTKNLAGFVSLHNYAMGKLRGNHWGDAVTVFETLSGSPYYFNFHYKDIGNFLVFGATGSGKTVLTGFLILQSMKFGGKRIIFDKDRGLEILVRAMRGRYERIKPNIKTRFNPCQLTDTPENRKFLAMLFRKMLTVNGESLTESDVTLIEQAIDGLYRMPQDLRQLCHVASFFHTNKKGSLRARFDQWHGDGPHAWLFDNEEDSLNLDADVIGFDLTHLLADEVCKTPALMYLTYRAEQVLEGNRGMIFFDEGWKALGEEYLKVFINNLSRILRKKNNIFGLATQVANDISQLGMSKAIHESAYCKFFFPNPGADRNVYVDELGLSEHEYDLVKTLPDNQHYFLLNHGRGINKESVILRLNLSKLNDLIAIISAREETLALLDQLLLDVGEDPDNWLPLFLARLNQGK